MILDPARIHRILLIKLRAIGDVLLSTAVIPNLREAFPHVAIDMLTEPPARQVLEGNPALSSILVFDRKQQSGLKLLADVRRRRYDCVIDLFGNPRSALVALFSGARVRVGYRFTWRQYCYTHIVEPRGGEIHNVQFNLDALRRMEIPIAHQLPQFFLRDEAEINADRFFNAHGLNGSLVVGLNAGGGWYTKRWRPASFSLFANEITERYGAKVLIVWGPGERKNAEQIEHGMKSPAVLVPETDLKQLASLLKRCSVFVTNDSGPMHIAASLGTPVVAIFGPTDPKLQGPVSAPCEVIRNEQLDCLCCNYTSCPIGNPCMEELSVGSVLGAFERLLQQLRREHVSPLSERRSW